MEKAFVYGMSVEGNNFTDRIKEAKRIKLDFENGIPCTGPKPAENSASPMPAAK